MRLSSDGVRLRSPKMNIAAVPRIDSIVLTGLDFSMKPENARYEADKGFIKPFPEIKVMHTLKSLAVMGQYPIPTTHESALSHMSHLR